MYIYIYIICTHIFKDILEEHKIEKYERKKQIEAAAVAPCPMPSTNIFKNLK